jgi:hypothetical protein
MQFCMKNVSFLLFNISKNWEVQTGFLEIPNIKSVGICSEILEAFHGD